MTDDMREEKKRTPVLSKEQFVYANLIHYASRIGVILLVLAGIVYFAGILPPQVSMDEIHEYWHLSLRSYTAGVQSQDVPKSSWGWIIGMNRGELFAYMPVVFLGLVTVGCYIRIAPILLKKRDYIYFGIVCIEVVVLLLSISGILNT